MKNLRIGEVLLQSGAITEEQLQQALQKQKEDSGKKLLGAVLIEMGYVTERQMLTALSQKLQHPLIELDTYQVDLTAVEKIPKQLASKYGLIAIDTEGAALKVAVSDPLNFYAIEDIRQIVNQPLAICLAESRSIQSAIEYYYAEIDAKLAASSANTFAVQEQIAVEEDDSGDEDAPVVKLLNSLLLRGYSTGTSDIHIEAAESQTLVRMRVDGILVDYVSVAKSLHPSLIARIKILANLDIAEKRLPQDGHFKVTLDGSQMNIRVSVIPTAYGEKAVLRYLTTNTLIDRSGQFGMSDQNYQKMLAMLQNPHGIIYFTGPTGSGKTTTLYMILEHLARQPVNISTIEDPVERNIPKVNQMQVNNTAGLHFENGLSSLLRQDPDIIMVGETRDNETAAISVRAAITGHLVLSTLHTNDAISSIVRLEDMEIEPYLIANSVVGVVAQRLVKKVCPHCGYAYAPDEAERAALKDDRITSVRRGKGCHLCNHTGYKGRTAVHEMVAIDGPIRRMITARAPVDEIFAYARQKQGMVTLKEELLRLVRDGVTTVEEMLKLTYYAD